MSGKLEFNVKQTITISDQTQGSEVKPIPASPQAPSVSPVAKSTPVESPTTLPVPEAKPTGEAKATSPESATPEVPLTKPEQEQAQSEISEKPKSDFLSRAKKKASELEQAGVEFSDWPDWLQKLKKRYEGTPKALTTEQAEAVQPMEKKPPVEEEVKPPKPKRGKKKSEGPQLVETPEAVETTSADTSKPPPPKNPIQAGGPPEKPPGSPPGTSSPPPPPGPPGGSGSAAKAPTAIGTGAADAANAALAVLAPEIELAIQVFQALVDVVLMLDKAFTQMSKDAAKYNSRVAMAEAQAEVRDIQAQMYRAQTLGPDLAQFTESKSKLGVEVQEIITNFSAPLLDWMTELLDGVNTMLAPVQLIGQLFQDFYEASKNFYDSLGSTVQEILGFIMAFGRGPLYWIGAAAKWWMGDNQSKQADNDLNDLYQQILNPTRVRYGTALGDFFERQGDAKQRARNKLREQLDEDFNKRKK